MTVFNKKISRMVSFRLSSDEYTEAMKCCQQKGHRSISALAREATLRSIPGWTPRAAIDPEIVFEMQEQIHLLRTELERLTGLVSDPLAATASASSTSRQQ